MKLTLAMTYELGKEQVLTLVDQERTDMALVKRSDKVVIKPVVQPIIQHDFSMSSNHVKMTRDEYDALVVAAAGPADIPVRQNNTSTYGEARRKRFNDGLCLLCGSLDKFAS